jgi:hypothetical protein
MRCIAQEIGKGKRKERKEKRKKRRKKESSNIDPSRK